MGGRPAWRLEKSKIRLTQPSLAGSGAELGNMLFNAVQCYDMDLNKSIKESTSNFTPNFEDIIEEKETLRYLVIILSNDEAFSSHVEFVCGKVKQKK